VSELDLTAAAAALRERIEACGRFWITVHESPDGDAIGAALALGRILERLGKRVVVIRQAPFPTQYERLPHAGEMVDPARLRDLFPPELILVVDVGSFDRVGPVQDYVRPLTHVINIDHHPGSRGPDRPCRLLNLVDTSVASTTMLVYQLLQIAYPGMVGPTEATCLYVGLLTDTGCFRHSNTDATTLRVAADLVALGADAGALAEEYVFRRSPQALRLLAAVLGTLELHAQGRFATIELTRDMLERTGARLDETEGFVNYATSIEGVHVAALFRELEPRLTKVSLRSSGMLDVGRLAAEFGGGGHANAAGLSVPAELAEARRLVATAALRHLGAPATASRGI
jgi:bifunctional oligoribonuclease and PAP phosphatase NrnA